MLRIQPRTNRPSPGGDQVGQILLAVLLAAVSANGCSSNKISLRSVPKSPLIEQLDLTSYTGPKPSPRTLQLLRVYNLTGHLGMDARPLLERLQAIDDREPSSDKVYALSELAFLGGKKAERIDKSAAMDLYATAALHAYRYLFDERFAATRNPYDPQYRGACDLYNGALESVLRIVCAKKELRPNTTITLHAAGGTWDLTCVLRGTPWQAQDFEQIKFSSDYEVTGMRNQYLTHGLGVPLIAVRHSYPGEPAAARYYPPGLSFPVTAFLRPLSRIDAPTDQAVGHNQGALEFYDPLATDGIWVGPQRVPLESDLTTPLAYFLSRPELNNLATLGLLTPAVLLKSPDDLLHALPGQARPIMGLYMAQPYEPGKIPVLMIHGLWSSPMTWMEMFNDLRSQPQLRRHYQFWFYLYPTDQPFWLSAAQLRHDLRQAREVLDPGRREPALDAMVLIGHSMGGLVARLQTLNSGDDFWKLVSSQPLSQIKTDPEVRRKLQATFFFQPNPSIRRVVTISTPFHGSSFSNQASQWLIDEMLRLPGRLASSQQKLFRDNEDAIPDNSLLRVETSIDSLAPSSPIFAVMLAAKRPPWVRYHNIIAVTPKPQWLTDLTGEGDGWVSRQSAHGDDVESELIVPADHTSIQMHPAAVLEVRRILLEHLAEMTGRR